MQGGKSCNYYGQEKSIMERRRWDLRATKSLILTNKNKEGKKRPLLLISLISFVILLPKILQTIKEDGIKNKKLPPVLSCYTGQMKGIGHLYGNWNESTTPCLFYISILSLFSSFFGCRSSVVAKIKCPVWCGIEKRDSSEWKEQKPAKRRVFEAIYSDGGGPPPSVFVKYIISSPGAPWSGVWDAWGVSTP